MANSSRSLISWGFALPPNKPGGRRSLHAPMAFFHAAELVSSLSIASTNPWSPGDATPAIGSPALLLQMATNLVHNAIVHNLAEHGTVWVTTSLRPESVVLTVENTGRKVTPQLVATLAEPFLRGSESAAPSTRVSASAWQSSRASPEHTSK